MRATVVILLIAIMTACRPSAATDVPAKAEPAPKNVTIPVPVLQALSTVNSATLYRVTGPFNSDWTVHRNAPKVHGFPAFRQARMSDKTVREFARVLSQPENYLAEGDAWTCLPHPIYLITFQSGHVVVDGCGDITMDVTMNGQQQQWSHGLSPGPGEKHLREVLGSILPPPEKCCD